jgi:predicted nucleic acid-binding protein
LAWNSPSIPLWHISTQVSVEAISLASELQAILLLMGERDGVIIARQRGLKVVGTLAALDLAAALGLVDLQTMFDRLRATTFRSPLRLMMSMLEEDAERKKRREGQR